jgi:hypothetical protein
MTQETIADGIKVIVDGHEVVVAEDQLTVDGKVQVLEPDQDVMVYVAEDGKVSVKIVHEDEAAGQEPSEEAPE